jgi:exopolyphosphatase / guanosine-5'-triphosphate,3'-diphosphate pyrophosphatase
MRSFIPKNTHRSGEKEIFNEELDCEHFKDFSTLISLQMLSSFMQRLAIIDMGTNTFHLLVASVSNGKHTVLLDEKHAVGLGRGGINEGLIAAEAMDRAFSTLNTFKGICDQYLVDKVLLTGTSAVRSASNKEKFIGEIKQKFGWDVLVLSGDQEAEGIYRGVSSAISIPEDNALIVDIGGGSVEFIICTASEGVRWKRSFEIGGQRLMEKFHASDPISEIEVEKIRSYLDEVLSPLVQAVTELAGTKTLIGSSGSFDTLCDMYCAEHGIQLEEGTSGFTISLDAYRTMSKELIQKNRIERLAIPGMITLRVDMIVVAMVLVDWLIEKLKIEKIEVSFYALKEGLLKQMMQQS